MDQNLVKSNIRKPRGRPKKSSSTAKDQLLQAALEIFAKKSFEGTNIREIAEKANVDVALISHHFGSKAELWKAVVNKIKEKFAEKFNEQILLSYETKNVKEHVKILLEYFVDIAVQIPEFSIFIFIETDNERQNYLIESFFIPFKSLLIPLIKKGIKEGIFAKQNEEVLFSMIIGSVSHLLTNFNTIKKFSNLSQDKDIWIKEIKHSLIANFIKDGL